MRGPLSLTNGTMTHALDYDADIGVLMDVLMA